MNINLKDHESKIFYILKSLSKEILFLRLFFIVFMMNTLA